uniref:RNA polymerase sigma factor n=1 Tax=Monsonia emarginata TaxID=28966 RepID=A0A0G2STT0_9ROSI|nr:sigma factor [Monsonia emarginata]
MSCLLPQFKCQPDTFAINFRAPLTKTRGPVYFQAQCVLSTISAPTSTATVMDAEKLQISSLENSVSAKSPWAHIEAIGPPTEASFRATLAREALLTSDEAVITAAAAEAVALAKAAVKIAKDAKALIVNNYQHGDVESRPTILSEVSSIQSSWIQRTEIEVSGVGASVEAQTGPVEDCSFQLATEESGNLEPRLEELKFLEEQLSKSVAVRSTRQKERKARRAKAATKAAASVVSVQPNVTPRRKKRTPAVDFSDPLRQYRTTTSSKLLTAAEERECSEGIQDLLKLERLHEELAARYGGEITFAQWAAAARVDQKTLRKRLDHGAYCKERMVKSNVRLVISIAKKFQGAGMDIQDLIQEGIQGLIKGAEKFDASKGFKFSTYAHWWIRQAVRKTLTVQSKLCRTPSHIVEAIYKVKEARKQFQFRNKTPTDEELAAAAGVTMKRFAVARRVPTITVSLDQTSENGDFPKLTEIMADPNDVSTEEQTMREYMRRDIEKLLEILTPRERQVIRWRIGLEDGRMKALQEIGDLMSVSRERVRQIETCAIRKLKSKKNDEYLKQYDYILSETG